MRFQRKDFLAVIGEVAVNWNRVEIEWYDLYSMIMSGVGKPVADVIYKRFGSAQQQRELVFSIASVLLADRPDFLAEVKSLYDQSAQLAKKRNLVIHSRYEEDWDDGDPSEFVMYIKSDELGRSNEFVGEPLITTLGELSREVANLAGEIFDLRYRMSKEIPEMKLRSTDLEIFVDNAMGKRFVPKAHD